MPCELPAPGAFDLDGRGDEPFVAEDGRDDGPGLDAPAAQKLREGGEALARRGEDALRVDGYGSCMVKALEVGSETVDTTGLLSQGDKERVHLAAARDGVGQVPRLALRSIKVSPDSLARGLATMVFGLRLEVVFQQSQRALRDVAVDEGRDRAEQGRVDRVLRTVADAAAGRAAVHAMLVADVREIVAPLGARDDEARAADRAPEKRGSQMPRRGHAPGLPARARERCVDLGQQRVGPDPKLGVGDA